MIKAQFLLPALSLTVIGLSCWQIQDKLTVNPEYTQASTFKRQAKDNRKEEFAGALEFYKQVRANQVTGKVEAKDVYAARDKANAMLKNKTRAFDQMKWDEAGPNNIGGRTRSLVIDKNNTNKLYMGSVGGGLWISTDNGDSWTRRSGNDSTIAIAISTVAQASNGDIYYGTGEGNTGFAGSVQHIEQIIQLGEGIFKSTDGGTTFNQLIATKTTNSNSPSDPWAYVDKIVAHPTNPDILFAATNGGVKMTTNGGSTWTKPTGLSVSARFCDIEISSDGNNVVAATTNALYVSNNGGTSFSTNKIGTNGLPPANTCQRVEIAIAPSDPNRIYLCIAGPNNSGSVPLKGVYQSTDAGATWTTIGQGGSAVFNPLGDQGEYDIAFGVHPLIPDMVFCGGQLDLWRYTAANGWAPIASSSGSPFQGLNVHADMHGIFFNPSNPENMYVVCDGGMYISFNSSATVPTFAEKNKYYSTAQCYGIAVNKLGRIVFGTQDNGSGILGTSVNSVQQSRDLSGGDGMKCAISDLNPATIFTGLPNGEMLRATDNGVSGQSFKSFFDRNIDNSPVSSPDGKPDDNANWKAPIQFQEKKINGKNKSYYLYGSNSALWMTQSALEGNTIWFKIQAQSGAGFSAVTSSADGKHVFAGTAGGAVYRLDLPSLWDSTYKYYDTITNLYGTSGYPYEGMITKTLIGSYGRFITDLAADPSGNTLVVTLGNFANTSYVARSLNALDPTPTFADITGDLPKMPVYTALVIGGNSSKLMIGTDLGVWGTSNGGTNWTELNMMDKTEPSTWHPRVATYDLVEKTQISDTSGAGYNGSYIYSGTHGRGVFSSKTLTKFWPNAINTIDENSVSIVAYPNPVTDMLTLDYTAESSNDVIIRIYSVTGTLVKSIRTKVNVGSNKLNLNLSDLAKGGYIVHLQDGQKRAITTMLKN